MPYPSWKHNPKLIVPSIANLSTTININGSDGTTVFAYRGIDATTAVFPAVVGQQLTKVEVGADVTPNYGSPLLGATDDSVLFNGADCFQYGTADFTDLTTEDLYWEVLLSQPPTTATTRAIFTKLAVAGYSLQFNTSGQLQASIKVTNPNYHQVRNTVVVTDYGLLFASGFVDRSESTDTQAHQIYVNLANAPLYTKTVNVNEVTTLTTAALFTIGASYTADSLFYTGGLLWVLAAAKNAWFAGGATNPTQWAAFHKARFNALFGLNAQIGNGTLYPTVTRACPAYSRKIESGATRYYLIGTGIPRTESILDASSNSVKGMMAEPAGTNYCRYSNDPNSWDMLLVTTPSTITNPFPHLGYLVTESVDGEDTTHYIRSVPMAVADKNGQTGFAYIVIAPKASGRDWIRLRVQRTAAGGTACYTHYQFSTKTFGTDLDIADKGVETLGTFGGVEWVLVWVKWACVTATTGLGITIILCEADNDYTYTGDGRDAFYLAFGQIEVASNLSYYTSPIIVPATVEVTRLADLIYYKGDDGNLGNVGSDKQGTIYVEFLYNPSVVPAATLPIFQINDGGASADSIVISIDTSGYLTATFTATAGTPRVVAGPAVSVCDRLVHNLRLAYRPGRAILFLDGAAGVEQTAIVVADIPDDLDRIHHDAGHTVVYPRSGFLRRPNWSGRLYLQ